MEAKKTKITPRTYRLASIVTLLGLGFWLGFWYEHQRAQTLADSLLLGHQVRQDTISQNEYKYIDPLIMCDIGGNRQFTEFNAVKQSITQIITSQIKARTVGRVSVYFDTRDGRFLTVNPTERYSPASLMKVPTMIAMFKAAEFDNSILETKITYTKSNHLNSQEYFTPREQMKVGQAYSVAELIERMIRYSDNETISLIIDKAVKNPDAFLGTYRDLGLSIPTNQAESQQDIITASGYANVFRALFNSTYLSRDYSEKAMSILTRTDFAYGIKAGVNSSTIAVAQKFGERNYSANVYDLASKKELHDCGVVYYPNHPYLLCVMTEGHNFADLEKVIRAISAAAYQFIDTTYGAR